MSRTPAGPGVAHGGRPRGAAGQGFVEFGVILAIAVLVALAVLVVFRPQLAWVLSIIGSEVDKSGWLAPEVDPRLSVHPKYYREPQYLLASVHLAATR